MAYVIMHQQYGLYLGSNKDIAYWSFMSRGDLPPAAQTFASMEEAISHITSWRTGNIPSAYSFIKIEDHGSGYVFEHEAVAQGFAGWLNTYDARPPLDLKISA